MPKINSRWTGDDSVTIRVDGITASFLKDMAERMMDPDMWVGFYDLPEAAAEHAAAVYEALKGLIAE